MRSQKTVPIPASPLVQTGGHTNYYAVTGVVETVSHDLTSAKIAHEEIPDYMEAMTMTLPVKDTNEFKGIMAGDKITFRMIATDDDGWIDQVKRIASGSSTKQSSAVAEEPDEPIQFLQVGDTIPDLVLTNQFGKEIKLSDYRGKALAFTFIFTKCPFPIYCPRMNYNFTDAQAELSSNPNATNWHLISISFDPKNDTSAVLESYAKRYKYNPDKWTFATGPEDRIRRFGASFGLTFMRKGGTIDHNLRTVVVDGSGKVTKIFSNNEWKPAELVSAVNQAMQQQ
ncbi:MAG: SCO family protein [Verrucomicrobiales bacterium]